MFPDSVQCFAHHEECAGNDGIEHQCSGLALVKILRVALNFVLIFRTAKAAC